MRPPCPSSATKLFEILVVDDLDLAEVLLALGRRRRGEADDAADAESV